MNKAAVTPFGEGSPQSDSRLARWMVVGTISTGIAASLSLLASLLYFTTELGSEGFETSDVIELARIAPEFFMLLAFLFIAREARSLSLWRSSIGLFTLPWLLTPSIQVAAETEAGLVSFVAGAIGFLLIGWLVWRRPSFFADSQQVYMAELATPIPRTSQRRHSAWHNVGGAVGGGALLIAAFLKHGAKFVRRLGDDFAGLMRGLRPVSDDVARHLDDGRIKGVRTL